MKIKYLVLLLILLVFLLPMPGELFSLELAVPAEGPAGSECPDGN